LNCGVDKGARLRVALALIEQPKTAVTEGFLREFCTGFCRYKTSRKGSSITVEKSVGSREKNFSRHPIDSDGRDAIIRLPGAERHWKKVTTTNP
jgi:hypothetical protein